MNCCTEVLELMVESRQVEEATLALLHTIIMHRSTGKFRYTEEGNYSITTVGTRDTDCHFIDFTFVRVSSDELDAVIRRTVSGFKDALNSCGRSGAGQIRLEFYQRKRCRWPFSDELVPWEVWNISIGFVSLLNEQERHICRQRVGKTLGESVVNVAQVVNLHQYAPNTPTQSEVDSVFDTSLGDVQPYLHKITYQVTGS